MASKHSNKSLTILHLDDDASFARKVKQKLIDQGFDITIDHVKICKEFFEHLDRQFWHAVFLDDHVADGNGLRVLEVLKEMQLPVPVVMFSDILDEVAIVNCLRRGAADYVLKTNLERLPEVMRQMISQNQKHNTAIDFQKLFETSADLLCSCDRQGHFINLNPTWSKVLEYPLASLKGKSFLDFIYPDDRELALARFKAMFGAGKHSGEFTGCFVTQGGDMRWLQWYATAQTDAVIYVIARDITELKQDEIKQSREQESLKQQIEAYKAEVTHKSIVANQIHDSVITTDLKGIITSWNNGSERAFGYTAEEAVGQHIALVYPEKDYKFVQHQAANILLEQGSQDLDLQMRRKSGEVFDARLSLAITRDHGGEVNGMVGYAVDRGPAITEEYKASSYEQRFESIIDCSPVVVYACDPQGGQKLSYVSPNIEILFGFPAARCADENGFLLNHCHPDDREQLANALSKLPDSESFTHAYRFKKADGEFCWMHNELRIVKDEAGKATEIVGMLIDVDNLHYVQQRLAQLRQAVQQKDQQLAEAQQQSHQWGRQFQNAEQQLSRLEQELHAAMQSLDELQRQRVLPEKGPHGDADVRAALGKAESAISAKSEFLACISHELRSTLNAVLGFTQIMALDESLNENNKQYLSEISDAGARLLETVARLVELVNLETGNAKLANETFDVLQAIDECIQPLNETALLKNVMLAHLPQNPQADFQLSGDKQRLQQVLLHVVAGVVNHAPDGSKVEIVPEKHQGAVRIAIKNPASGLNDDLPPETGPQRGMSTRFGNSRLELLISQTLLGLMGGGLRYEFDPGKVIVITLAETVEPVSAQPADDVVDKVLNQRESAEEKTILYVEADPASIRLVESLLKQRPNCRLVATRSPAQCAELAARHHPCLILLDINLPETDAYGLLTQWRQDAVMQDIPVVVIATDVLPDGIDKEKTAGAVEFLAKPIEIKRFLSVMDAFLATPGQDQLKQVKTN